MQSYRKNPKAVSQRALLAVVAAVSMLAGKATADDWTGALTGQFTLNENWGDLTAPGNSDAANFAIQGFAANTFVTLDSNRTVLSMTVQRQSGIAEYHFSRTGGAVLTVTNRLFVNDASGVDNPVQFNGFQLNAASLAVQGDTNTTTLSLNSGAVLGFAGVAQINAASSVGTAVLDINSLSSITSDRVVLNNHARVNINSGSMVTTGASGVLVHSGGTLTLASGGTVSIANNSKIAVEGSLVFNRDYRLPGTATLAVTLGGTVASTSYLDIVGSGSGTGTMTVDGSASKVDIGIGGNASFTDWAAAAGANAVVSFSNSGQGTYSSGLHIASGGGTAKADILSSSALTVGNGLQVGGTGAATLNITGGRLTSSGTAAFNNNATLTLQSGGSINFNGDATFSTGSRFTWTNGAVNIASGKTLNVAGGAISGPGGTALGTGATIKVTNNAGTGGVFDNASYFAIANGAATGTLLVDGVGSRFTALSTTDLGRNNGNAATVTFQNSGVGTYSSLQLSIGGGASTLNLQNSGQLNVTSSLTAGGVAGASARMNIAGGTFNNLGQANFLSGSTLTLSNGGILLNANATFSLGAVFNWSGGTVTFAAGKVLSVDGGAANVTGGRGLPTGGTLRVVNSGATGGQFTANSYFDIANGTGSGTLLISGANSLYKTQGGTGSDWAFNPTDTATITIANSGVASLTLLDIGQSGGSALVNLNSGGKLVVGDLSTGRSSPDTASVTINADGGGLQVSGFATLRNTTKVSVLNGGSAAFDGGATFSTGASINVGTNGILAWGSNTTLAFNGGVGTYAGAVLALESGRTLALTNGGEFTANLGVVNISSGTGTLLVDGLSKFITNATGGATAWGQGAGNSAVVTFSNGGAGTIANQVQLGVGGSAVVNVQSGASLFADNIITTFAGGSATINVNGGTLRTAGDFTLNNGATLNYAAGSVNVGGILNVSGNAQVLLTSGGGKILRAGTPGIGGGLGMSASSKIDLSDNTLLIGYNGASTVATIRAYLITGRAGGAWTGNQLTSSAAAAAAGSTHPTALGFIDDTVSDLITVKYTFLGDANLDSIVDIKDLYLLALHFNTSSTLWNSGDFNYDGLVNAVDLGSLARNWQVGTSNAVPLASALASFGLPQTAVPEPGLLMLMAPLCMMGRRRRAHAAAASSTCMR